MYAGPRRRGARRRRLGIALACWIACLAGSAQAGPSDDASTPVLVAGFLPLTKENGAADIRGLSEAQTMRNVAEGALRDGWKKPVLGYDAITKKLGKNYLVNWFKCGGKTKCISYVLLPMRKDGAQTSITGEYFVVGDVYRFHMVAFSIDTGVVEKEINFEMSQQDTLDPKKWMAHLAPFMPELLGRIRIKGDPSVAFECTLDGTPCKLEPDGHSIVTGVGDHALELKVGEFPPVKTTVTVEVNGEQPVELPTKNTVVTVTHVTPPPVVVDRFAIPKLTGPISLDGSIDEAAWKAVPPAHFTTHWPEFGKKPAELTEAYIAHDDANLYIAFRNGDSHPDGIKVTALKRDLLDFGSQDINAVVLDSFNDNENALAFYTNVAGVRTDGVITNDAAVIPALVTDPNMFWDVATHRDAKGWSSEFRIPFSTLRYDVVNGTVTMGVILYRLIPRTSELSTYPAIESDYAPVKPSRAQDLTITGVTRRTPLYVTPYVLGGFGAFTTVDDMTMAVSRDTQYPKEIGGDIKLGVASNFTLDATINPDFAQVEADDQQINLNRFNLFFPEKRPFFLERAAVLEVPLSGIDRLFYSRRIGILAGQQARILGGLRGVGRVGSWDVGVMNVQTQEVPGVAPSENMGVLRLRRQMLDRMSYVGGLVTTRLARDGSYNAVGALDSLIKIHGDDILSVNAAHGWWNDGMEKAGDRPIVDSLGRIKLERRRNVGLLYSLETSRAGRRFDPGLGFLERSDFTQFGTKLGYGVASDDEESFVRQQTLVVTGAAYTRNKDNSVESAFGGPAWDVETKNDSYFGFYATGDRESVTEAFPLGDQTEVPAGTYSFFSGGAYYTSPAGSSFNYSPSVDAGQFFDGLRVSPRLQLTLRATEHLTLTTSYSFNYITFKNRNAKFLSHLALLRSLLMFNSKLSLIVFGQVNSVVGSALLNARLRYNPREGHDLYLVYDESRSYDGRDPTLDRRTFLLKYAYTFDLGW